ncbi:type IV secretory system conjugative DNA transfer family protein [Streptomyces spiramyceticus]|uniref:type IV secretory system conjugative DNA transfer family protein n=1 Tax=Streptomyces spiramyceticus TaxID=299717 RepID=UPI00237A881D|nr:type IV secretion system DNA-binding domain-containing protein [Streptomyces spiramyceticus]
MPEHQTHQETPARRTYVLSFPKSLRHDAVLNFFRALAGPLRPSLLDQDATVAIELYGDKKGIQLFLSLDPQVTEAVDHALLTHLPGATMSRVDEADDPITTTRWTRVIEVGTTNPHAPLRIASPAAVTAGLLSCFTRLEAGEALAQQFVVTGARPYGEPPGPRLWPPGRAVDRDAFKRKQADVTFLAIGRMAATGPNPSALLARLQAHYGSLRTHGVSVRKRLARSSAARRRLQLRAGAWAYPATLSAEELTAVIGWPFGVPSPYVPGLPSSGTRQLAPEHAIPKAGAVFAMSTFPGAERPLAISTEDRAAHTLVVGPTGTGKSTLIENLISQDIAADRGVIFVDPKGDAVSRVLDAIPRERLADVVVFDVTDEQPIGLNVLAGERPDRIAGQLMLIFDQLFELSRNTPRAFDVLRNTLMTLAMRGRTVIEVPWALAPGPRGQAFRDFLTAALDHDELREFWRWFNHLSTREQAETGAPITRRLRPLLLYPELRCTFGQLGPGLDLGQAIRERQIVLVPLYRAQLHEEANLVGTLLLNQLWNTVQSTELVDQFSLYVDEFKDVAHLAVSFGDLLAKARGHRLPITLATQDVSRLSEGLRKDVLNNTRTKIFFQPAGSDLSILTRELGGWVSEDDLANLGSREIVARVNVGGAALPPVTGRTLPPPPPVGLGNAARAASRARYGRPRDEVEAEIRQRLRAATGGVRQPTAAPAPPLPPQPPEEIGWEEWEL